MAPGRGHKRPRVDGTTATTTRTTTTRTKTAGTTKTKRGDADTKGQGKTQRSVPPPGPPPPSLVKLLRRDKAVLQYFKALQANLEADVQIWKDRAHKWERQLEAFQKNHQGNVAPTMNIPTKQALRKTVAVTNQGVDEQELAQSQYTHDNHNHNHNHSDHHSDHSSLDSFQLDRKRPADTKKNIYHENDKIRTLPSSPLQSIIKDNRNDTFFELDSDSSDYHRNGNKICKKDKTPITLPPQEREITEADLFDLSSSSSSDEDEETMKKKSSSTVTKPVGKTIPTLDKDTSVVALNIPMNAQPGKPQESDKDSKDHNDDEDEEDSLFLSSKYIEIRKPAVHTSTQVYYEEVLAAWNELNIQTTVEEEDDGDIGDEDDGEEEHEQAINKNKDPNNNNNNNNKQKVKRSRTNDEIVRDLQAAIHLLCRVEDQPPFCNGQPAYRYHRQEEKQQRHPVSEGIRLIFRSVVLLDTFAPLWKGTDLGGRDGILPRMEQSLRREIQQGWATADRALRLRQTTLHYNPATEDLNNASASEDDQIDAKTLQRLSFLLERAILARLFIGFCLSRNSLSAAKEAIQAYLMSSIPSMKNEESLYPRLAPVFSFVVFEALLKPDLDEMGWKSDQLQANNESELISFICGPGLPTLVRETYTILIHFIASIWMARACSRDAGIRHLAEVECAAYKRVCTTCGLPENPKAGNDELLTLDQVRSSLEQMLGDPTIDYAYKLCLVFDGYLEPSFMTWEPKQSRAWNLNRLDCMCQSMRQLKINRMEEIKNAVGSKVTLNSPPDPFWEECREQFAWLWELNPFDNDGLDRISVLAFILKGVVTLADGESAIHYGNQLIDLLQSTSVHDYIIDALAPALNILLDVTHRPLLRVINLQRRHDRWNYMVHQAMFQNYLILRAVGELVDSDSNGSTDTLGGFAFDGHWTQDQFLDTIKCSTTQLRKRIQTDWSPLDLAPFDKDAPRGGKMVSMHTSEVACALSHIASWKACERTFALADPKANEGPPSARRSSLIRETESFRQALQLAGHARGAPLQPQNTGMHPSPVCLVIEDDAHVSDDFCESLEALLAQLPCDFHTCAIGYSRPKSAPIVPFPSSPCVGVPTHLFFATGYLVSAAGVKHLESCLPVQGPIDTWLGLKQTKNFDNILGQRLGVGSNGRGGRLRKSQLASLLRDFGAFCATPPLCQQPMKKSNVTSQRSGGGYRRWKDRDTDIVFSGHV